MTYEVPGFVKDEVKLIGGRFRRFHARLKDDLAKGSARLRKIRQVDTALRAGQTVVVVPLAWTASERTAALKVAQGSRHCGCNVVGETVYPCRAHAVDASELQYGIEIDTWQRRWHTPMGQPLPGEEQRRQSRDRFGEGGFNPSKTERRTGPSSMTPDIEYAIVLARDALMAGILDSRRVLALDTINDVLKRAGYVWVQLQAGPKVLMKPPVQTV